MSFAELQHRLTSGRPLVLDADTGACFRSRGRALSRAGALGKLLRENPDAIVEHYLAEVNSRVDVLCALTSDTTPRALAEVGMEHRAAMLTGLSVDLALDVARAADRAVGVAGVLGSDMVSAMRSDRLVAELEEHAERLAVAGCELFLARALGSHFELMAAVRAGTTRGLPVWAVLEATADGQLVTGDSIERSVTELREAGVSVVLFEISGVDHAERILESAREVAPATKDSVYGVLVAGGVTSVRGFPDDDTRPGEWAHGASRLDAAGARVIGGGAGTTESHTAALAHALGALHPSIPVPAPI
ncbi:MAG: homocysteine S-methyltransferase family protein [Myxococcales bacterium]|nr:homocysteine S-methyltransferase family protein [Myxococcales bacterium]